MSVISSRKIVDGSVGTFESAFARFLGTKLLLNCSMNSATISFAG